MKKESRRRKSKNLKESISFGITIEKKFYDKIKTIADKKDRSISYIVRELIAKSL